MCFSVSFYCRGLQRVTPGSMARVARNLLLVGFIFVGIVEVPAITFVNVGDALSLSSYVNPRPSAE